MYPSAYEFDIVLRDGGIAQFRPITPDDAKALVEFFDDLGQQSRYFRFFRVKNKLTDEEVEYFTHVDYIDRMAFVVYHEDKLVGVGRYDRDTEDPKLAEVAFLVSDSEQGRGMGTQLLQLLTTYARAHDVERFSAFVLPDNLQMMRVFRNSGYELHRTLDEGVYHVDFPLTHGEDARAAEARREQRAVAASILPIFYPRSIAVVGASRNPASIGGRLFKNLMKTDFSGVLYPVNPNSDVVNSVRAYSSVLDVPDAIDLAIIVVPSHLVLGVVRDCAEKGVRGLVVISAGFSELGPEGAAAEEELLSIVRTAGMRMVGPNCMGVLNTDPAVSMNGTFAPVYPPRGNVAMLSQSGALGIAILDYARRHNIGISTFVSVGNKADVSGNDLILSWENDPSTDVIVLYLESFGNPRRFARLAKRVARKKPIVAVKSGRTAAGTRAASSHTGALASVDTAVDALFRQTGVIRTTTIEELFDVASLLSSQPLPRGRRVGVVTNAGGPGILAADAIESAGLSLPEFSEKLQKHLRKVLPDEASTRNPVDLIASAGPEAYAHSIESLLESDEIDAVIGIHIPTTDDPGTDIAAAVMEVATKHREKYGEDSKTMISVLMQSSRAGAALASEAITIPAYEFPEAAALALVRATEYAEWLNTPLGEIPTFDDVDPAAAKAVVKEALERLGEEGGWLEPDEVAAALAAFGIHLPKSATALSADEAVAAAAEIGGPVAMKVISPSALHKSDVGGVELYREGDDEVRAAYDRVTNAVPDPEGVLVQEMISGGHEVLIGMTEDPSFGPLIVFGLGGVYVELLGDVSFRVHPITDREAGEMVHEIKASRLLDGYRGFPPGDVPATEETLLRISALIEAVPELVEMDLNPVKVLAPGEGAVVVDARMRVVPIAEGWSPELIEVPSVAGTHQT